MKCGGKSDEKQVLALCVSEMCGVLARCGSIAQRAQVGYTAHGKRSERPLEFRATLKMHVGPKVSVVHLGARDRSAQLSPSLFEKWCPQGYMLRPGDWPIPSRKILHPFP